MSFSRVPAACTWGALAPGANAVGIRRRCEAQQCGSHLYDDLQNIRLPLDLINAPPLMLWPNVVRRAEIPVDIREAFAIETR